MGLAEGQGFEPWIGYKRMPAIKLRAPSTELKKTRFRPHIINGEVVATKSFTFPN